jgi:hypothetical protein
MFGILKNEPHVQPKAGCYSNQVHYDEVRSTLMDVSSIEQDSRRQMVKDFWIRNCEAIRAREQANEQGNEQAKERATGQANEKAVAKEHADQLLAFTKRRALNRATLKQSVA